MALEAQDKECDKIIEKIPQISALASNQKIRKTKLEVDEKMNNIIQKQKDAIWEVFESVNNRKQ